MRYILREKQVQSNGEVEIPDNAVAKTIVECNIEGRLKTFVLYLEPWLNTVRPKEYED